MVDGRIMRMRTWVRSWGAQGCGRQRDTDLQRPRLALEAVAQLEDAPLSLGQSVERLAHALAAQATPRPRRTVGGLAVGEKVSGELFTRELEALGHEVGEQRREEMERAAAKQEVAEAVVGAAELARA